jgi:hypothetical protein
VAAGAPVVSRSSTPQETTTVLANIEQAANASRDITT